ncbi:lipopolysaccharide-induced tumor necrosis factor-alpha factor homolog [Convolutriloba macropyga]|uniref:lipopolysaccharide-induced tumor necrosis factor-alpha factor homolog n=1 Tax=Convolutriloba macropyga TaxID=536237 RepID=UPI003F51FD67
MAHSSSGYPTAPPPGYSEYPPPPAGQGYPNNQPGPQPPPPPGYTPYAPGYAPPPVTTTRTTYTVIAPTRPIYLGHHPATLTCPLCRETVTTRVEHRVGSGAWQLCLFIFLAGCLFTCLLFVGFVLFFVCWIPFVLVECRDTTHTCPNCNKVIGEKRYAVFD